MSDTVIVMLQWNDWRNGSFVGVLFRAEFAGIVEIESPYCDSGIKAKLEGSCVVLGGKNAERFVDRAIWYKGGGCPALAKNVMNSRFEDFWLLSNNESPQRFEDIWLLAPGEKPSRALETAEFRGTVSNVIECGSNGANKNSDIHTATMPMAVAAYALGNWSKRGASIYEPFSGCGTTMIAAEQLGRRCYAMEIDPLYCDVAVERWEKFAGKKAKLERAAAGRKP